MDIDAIIQDFNAWANTDKLAKSMWKHIEKGNASYIHATQYAEAVGSKFAELIRKYAGENPSAEDIEVIRSAIEKSYNHSAYYTNYLQKELNAKAGVNVKAIVPLIEQERVDGLVGLIGTDGIQTAISNERLSTFARSAVTDTAKANARFQKQMGLKSFIERDPGAGCCEWCNKMAGRYEYGKQPNDFFRVHSECTCNILFQPAKSGWQKITYRNDENGKLKRITEFI